MSDCKPPRRSFGTHAVRMKPVGFLQCGGLSERAAKALGKFCWCSVGAGDLDPQHTAGWAALWTSRFSAAEMLSAP